MEKTNKTVYPKSTLYTRELIYESTGVSVEVKALTFKELDTLHSKYNGKPNSLKVNTVKQALIDKEDFALLNSNQIDELFDIIIDTSSMTVAEYDLVVDSIGIMKEDTFKEATFKSCALCQEKGLDALRNCPKLDKETHSPDVYYLVINKKLTECPMDAINDNVLVSDAMQAFMIYKNKMLPMEGGLLDQTTYFYRIAPVVHGLLNTPSLEDLG